MTRVDENGWVREVEKPTLPEIEAINWHLDLAEAAVRLAVANDAYGCDPQVSVEGNGRAPLWLRMRRVVRGLFARRRRHGSVPSVVIEDDKTKRINFDDVTAVDVDMGGE